MFSRLSNGQSRSGGSLNFRTTDAVSPVPAPAPGLRPALAPDAAAPLFQSSSRYVDLKVRLHQELLDAINLANIDKVKPEAFRLEVAEVIGELLAKRQVAINASERQQLINDIIDEVLGLGPIEPLLKDPTVSDILVNTHAKVYVEKEGRLESTLLKFKDDKHLLRIIDKIVSRVGRRIDESSPLVDARLPDGSRVNAIIPPLAVDGPLLSIRKFAKVPLTMERLIEMGSITAGIAEIVGAIVRGRLNVIVSGGTGTGKTTFLNAMSRMISHAERIVTIEDAAELQLQQPHVARLETRPPSIEGKGEIAQRDLLKNALRMRPDRIIVGEVRGGEAFDMLQAMNTGHDGSLTTIHANSCRDAFSRLEQMIGMSGLTLPMRSMRAQIASAVHVVLQLHRFADGTRRLVSLHEVTGMEGDVVTMQEIFQFRQSGVDSNGKVQGIFAATGIRPRFVDLLESRGLSLSPDIFTENKRIQ